MGNRENALCFPSFPDYLNEQEIIYGTPRYSRERELVELGTSQVAIISMCIVVTFGCVVTLDVPD